MVFLRFLWRRQRKIPTTAATITATPPTTPPAIAPTGVEEEGAGVGGGTGLVLVELDEVMPPVEELTGLVEVVDDVVDENEDEEIVVVITLSETVVNARAGPPRYVVEIICRPSPVA